MDTNVVINMAKKLVKKYINENTVWIQDSTDGISLVWFCKTLQNAKALLIADTPDGSYYEVTYNGDKDEFYLDVYYKEYNKATKRKDVK